MIPGSDLGPKEPTILHDEILGLGGPGDPVRLRAELSVGRNFGYFILSIIAATLLFLGMMLKLTMPTPPALNDPNAVVMIEHYKDMSIIATDNVTKIFDLVVTKGLLPVFTLIVGYVLGTHVRNKDSPVL